MRFASIIFLLATFVSMTVADDGKQPAKDLSPNQRMELAMAEYHQLLTAQYTPTSWPDDVRTKEAKRMASEQKRLEIIKLHKSLGLMRDQNAYEKAKADRIKIGRELEKYDKKDLERLHANLPIEMKKNATSEDLKKLIPKEPDDRHLLRIELLKATLLESLNTVLPPFDKNNRKGPPMQLGRSFEGCLTISRLALC